MNLMDQYAKECVLITRVRTDDPVGGYKSTWVDGIHFIATWEFESAPEITIAEQQGVSRTYNIYVEKALDLDFHEVFRRTDNGLTYRVVNPGTDRHTPATSRLNKRLVQVERWDLPADGDET